MTMFINLASRSGYVASGGGGGGAPSSILEPRQFDNLYRSLVTDLKATFSFKSEPFLFINVPTGGTSEKEPELGYMGLEALRQQVESLIAATAALAPKVTKAFQKLRFLRINTDKGQGEVVRAFLPFRLNGYNTAFLFEKIIGKLSDYFSSSNRSERKECEKLILRSCLHNPKDYYYLSVPLEDSQGKAGFLGIAHFILHREDIMQLKLIDEEGDFQADQQIVQESLNRLLQVVRKTVDRAIANQG